MRRSRIALAPIATVAVLIAAVACGGSVSSIDPASSTSSSSGSTSSSTSSSSGSSSGNGSSSGGDRADGSVDGGAQDATKDAGTPNDPSCPKTFAVKPGNCVVGTRCQYDQGSCACAGYCGGPPPPPDEDLSHWTCTPKRTDGCPDDPPKNGDACSPPGKACSYENCCIEKLVCGQTSGKWTSTGLICPP